MENRLDIYKRKGIYEQEKALLAKSAISEANKAKIREFSLYLFAEGAGDLRVAKLSAQLRKLAALFDKDFIEVTRDDIVDVLAKLNRENTSDREIVNVYTGKVFLIRGKPMTYNTKRDYLRILKRFFKWLTDDDNTPLVRKLKIHKKESERYPVIGDIITDEEMLEVLRVCRNQRDKALLSLLHETGARTAEILNIRMRDISHSGKIKKIRLMGKTGERQVPIINSIPYIMNYLENHSGKDNPDSYLWLSDNPRYKGEPLCYAGFRQVIKRNFKKAGLEHKKQNPHFFRHSRGTILAGHVNEVQECLYMGWKIGSEQMATYVHASGVNVDKAILKMHGMEEEEEKVIINKPKNCGICKELNEGAADFCNRCGYPLSVKSAMSVNTLLKEETDKAFQLLLEIAKDPKLMKEFEEFKKSNQCDGNRSSSPRSI